MFLLLTLCLQTPAAPPQTQAPAPAPPVVSLERIRRGLERPTGVSTPEPQRQPDFRVKVEESLPPERLWQDGTAKAQTFLPLDHHEFLQETTPEEFRAGVLNPIGIEPIALIGSAIKHVRKGVRERTERRTRATIRKELDMLLEARKAAGIR